MLYAYHVTNEQGIKKILAKGIQIRIPLVVNQGAKAPGSLGYGLYTFVVDTEHSEMVALSNFVDRMYNIDSNKYSILKLQINFSSENILDLNDSQDRMSYREFYEKMYRSAKNICRARGFHMKSKKQHVFDGVMIELYAGYLKKRGRKLFAVQHNTYTPSRQDSDMLSDIENGTELCIRNDSIIIHHEIVEGLKLNNS